MFEKGESIVITSLNVANTFLDIGFKESVDISPMKLQKLIYILYKEYMRETNSRLFDENFETWKYGPVLPCVYNAFKKYGSKPIRAFVFNEDDTYTTLVLNQGSKFYAVFYDVWNKYKDMSGTYLSALTHREGTAWYKAFKSGNVCLNDEDIREELSYV